MAASWRPSASATIGARNRLRCSSVPPLIVITPEAAAPTGALEQPPTGSQLSVVQTLPSSHSLSSVQPLEARTLSGRERFFDDLDRRFGRLRNRFFSHQVGVVLGDHRLGNRFLEDSVSAVLELGRQIIDRPTGTGRHDLEADSC